MKLSDIPPTWRKHAEQQLAGAVSTKPAKAETVTGGPVKLTLPYPPSVNHFWRYVGGRPIISSEGRRYKAHAAAVIARAGVVKLDGPVTLSLAVYRPKRIGDLDNRMKVLIDCIKGIAFGDDSEIVEIHATRHDDKTNPRVEVEVTAIPEVT